MIRRLILAAVVFTAAPLSAQVGPAGTLAPLPAATFGGSGIPNDAVMQSTFGGVTLGMNATQRYSNPTVTNNGAGVFYAAVGDDGGGLARWNFNWFVGGSLASRLGYSYRLFIDFNPASGTSQGDHVQRVVNGVYLAYQGSENLGFGHLNFFQPTGFDPNAHGSYTFALHQYRNGNLVNHVGMEVIVGDGPASTVPEPATMLLLGTSIAGMALVGRRRLKVETA